MISSAWESLKDLLKTEERCDKPSCMDEYHRPNTVYPPDRSQIGRANWSYVHARADSYPESPTKEEQEKEITWIKAFTVTYPCAICARDFASICARIPPAPISRTVYDQWWREVHNEVNRDLSKPRFKRQ